MENNTNKKHRVVNIFKAITFLILFITSLSIKAQDQRSVNNRPLFSFEFVETPIKQVFDYIQAHSDYVFLYYGGVIDNSTRVTIKVKNQDINNVLKELFKGMPVDYSIKQRQIILKKSQTVQTESKEEKTIRGIVSDESTQEPIGGATIRIKGTNKGTTTNIDGAFTLQCAEGDSLIISFIGYQDAQLSVKSTNIYAVTMKEASEQIDEIVVTAFGVGQKRNLW